MQILNPIASLFYLIHLAANIAMLFVAVRIILQFKKITWLTQLDKIGGPLTEAISNSLGNFVSDKLHKKLSEKGRLLTSLIVLTLVDMLLVYLINANT